MVAVLAPAPVLAACFCLEHPFSGDFQWGCVAEGPDASWCVSSTPKGADVVRYAMAEGFVRVSEGSGMCLPCMPPGISTEAVPVDKLPPALRGIVIREVSGDGVEPPK